LIGLIKQWHSNKKATTQRNTMLISLKVLAFSTALALLLVQTSPLQARTQRGYSKKNGTYVQPHQKANPDSKRYNNKGARSNGGKQRDEFSSPPAYNKSRNH
jgi:hypothetical protein